MTSDNWRDWDIDAILRKPAPGFTAGWIVRVETSKLEGAALDWAYEEARCPSSVNRDMKMGDKGLLILLNDEANPPGWYFYAPRYKSVEEARALILAKLGPEVRVPIEATRIKNPTYTVFPQGR